MFPLKSTVRSIYLSRSLLFLKRFIALNLLFSALNGFTSVTIGNFGLIQKGTEKGLVWNEFNSEQYLKENIPKNMSNITFMFQNTHTKKMKTDIYFSYFVPLCDGLHFSSSVKSFLRDTDCLLNLLKRR